MGDKKSGFPPVDQHDQIFYIQKVIKCSNLGNESFETGFSDQDHVLQNVRGHF